MISATIRPPWAISAPIIHLRRSALTAAISPLQAGLDLGDLDRDARNVGLGGQIGVEQGDLLFRQGFGLAFGEAALGRALDETVGVERDRIGGHPKAAPGGWLVAVDVSAVELSRRAALGTACDRAPWRADGAPAAGGPDLAFTPGSAIEHAGIGTESRGGRPAFPFHASGPVSGWAAKRGPCVS